MNIRLDLKAETEARLLSAARTQGVPPEKVVEQILNEALTERSLSRGTMSVEEFHRMLGAMAEGSEKLPQVSTERFSRASFYEDRLDGGNALPRR